MDRGKRIPIKNKAQRREETTKERAKRSVGDFTSINERNVRKKKRKYLARGGPHKVGTRSRGMSGEWKLKKAPPKLTSAGS